MAQHGYMGDGYGIRGERGDDYGRDRKDREPGWGRDEQRGRDDRSGFMFDDDREGRHRGDWDDRQRFRSRSDWNDEDRYSARGGNDRGSYVSGWGSDSDRNRGDRSQRQSFGGFGNQTGWEDRDRGPSNDQHDHYRSWRDRQMQALDRDYQDYCREREQQFHQDFDSWRQDRQQSGGGNQSLGSNRTSDDNGSSTLMSNTEGRSTLTAGDATSSGQGSQRAGTTATPTGESLGESSRRKPRS